MATAPASGQEGRSGGARGGGAATPAGPIPRTPDGKPDLTGTWLGRGPVRAHTFILEEHPGAFGIQAGRSLIIDPPDGKIPYQPWALAERDRRREPPNGYEDPSGHCELDDLGRLHTDPQEFVYSGNNIVIYASGTTVRVIDMTRRQHLPDGIRLWLGDPIGRWEGDTLVVDSTNFNGKPRMAIGGDFYGPNARVVERFTMVNSDTITWTMTITDPDVFTRPWTMTSAAPMTRQRDDRDFDTEDTCHEGNLFLVHLKNVYEQTHGTVPARK